MRKRRTSSYLNQLRQDVYEIQMEIHEIGYDIEGAAQKLSCLTPHDLVTSDADFKEAFDTLVSAHKEMGNLLTSFRKARSNYLEFF
jgi:hypothetical protein